MNEDNLYAVTKRTKADYWASEEVVFVGTQAECRRFKAGQPTAMHDGTPLWYQPRYEIKKGGLTVR